MAWMVIRASENCVTWRKLSTCDARTRLGNRSRHWRVCDMSRRPANLLSSDDAAISQREIRADANCDLPFDCDLVALFEFAAGQHATVRPRECKWDR